MREMRSRSVAKAVSWRLCGTITTVAVVFVLSGKLVLSLEVGAFELISKVFAYYLHERFWNSVRWGREA